MVANEPELPELHANVRQEIGVMVGFIALFIIVTAVFSTMWSMKNKRQAAAEAERQRLLIDKGWGMKGWEKLGPEKTKNGPMGGSVEQHEVVDRPQELVE